MRGGGPRLEDLHLRQFIYACVYARFVPSVPRALAVLAEPNRRRIVEQLRPGERSVGSLVKSLGTCQPGVSRHLRILHRAGFVRVRAEGQRRFYSLRGEPFRDLETWIRDYRDLIETRLDRIEELIESERVDSNSAPRTTRRRDRWKPK